MAQRRGKHFRALLALASALLFSGLLVLAGLDAGRSRAHAAAAPIAAAADQVLAQPRSYLYQDATVRGQVLRLWGQHCFALSSHSVHQGLLIILDGQTAAEANLHPGQRVEVAGQVRPVARAELQALRPLMADVSGDTLLALFSGDPYVLAHEVRPLAGRSPQP